MSGDPLLDWFYEHLKLVDAAKRAQVEDAYGGARNTAVAIALVFDHAASIAVVAEQRRTRQALATCAPGCEREAVLAALAEVEREVEGDFAS